MKNKEGIVSEEEPEEFEDKTAKMVYMDLDLVNLGLWLDINGEFFDRKHPMRLVRWVWLTSVTLTSQLIMVMYLIYEMLNTQLQLTDAKQFILEPNEENNAKFDDLTEFIQELATEYLKIDASWNKYMYSILSVHVMVVIFSYVVRSVQ